MPQDITSSDNPKIKQVVRLLSQKKERDRAGVFVTEGARLGEEVVRSGLRPKQVFLTREAEARYPEQATRLLSQAEQSFYITSEISAKIADTKSPQGIFAVCPKLDNSPHIVTIRSTGFYLLLDTVQDPGNVGTILRTAQALGVDGVWLFDSADIYSPKVLRGAMGGLFRLPIGIASDLSEPILALQKAGLPVWGAALTADAKPVSRSLFSAGGAMLIGNEGSGLSDERLATCDGSVIIPMAGGAESLNAAAAASILIWEMTQGKSKDKE